MRRAVGHRARLLVILAAVCVLCNAQDQQSSPLPSSTTTLPPSTTPLASSTLPVVSTTSPLTSSTTTTPVESSTSTPPLATTTESVQSDKTVCECGPNSKCDRDDSTQESLCSCLEGYEGPPPNCLPGAKLREVCFEGNPCGPDSECEMDAEGKRFCRCAAGYFGCPPNCEVGPRRKARCDGCGPNSHCDADGGCHCLPGFVGEPPECTAGKELLKICDPYPCGSDSGCVKRNDIAWCYCLPGYVGAAPNCRPGPEMYRLCVRDRPCGYHSTCEVKEGAPVCSPCTSGYSGTPPDCVKEAEKEPEKQADTTNTTRI